MTNRFTFAGDTPRETTCPKCHSLAGSSHVDGASCTAWLRLNVREHHAAYLAWRKRLRDAENAWMAEYRTETKP